MIYVVCWSEQAFQLYCSTRGWSPLLDARRIRLDFAACHGLRSEEGDELIILSEIADISRPPTEWSMYREVLEYLETVGFPDPVHVETLPP